MVVVFFDGNETSKVLFFTKVRQAKELKFFWQKSQYQRCALQICDDTLPSASKLPCATKVCSNFLVDFLLARLAGGKSPKECFATIKQPVESHGGKV